MRTSTSLFVGAILLLAFSPSAAIDQSRSHPRNPADRNQADAAGVPYIGTRVHHVGKIRFGIGNWGVVGRQSGGERDACILLPAPSFEYPRSSRIDYLFQGALWVGAVKGGDTLVSVGADGWNSDQEMYPAPYPAGEIIGRTTRPILRAEYGSTCPDVVFTPEAVSEQDFVAVYADTLFDPYDLGLGGPHIPLGLEVTQESYAWSYAYADEFVIVNWQIENVSTELMQDVRLGFFFDADVGHVSAGSLFDDDICGFLRTVPSMVGAAGGDTMNLAWAADNDGDPGAGGVFDDGSPTAVLGVRLLGTPTGKGTASFNWGKKCKKC